MTARAPLVIVTGEIQQLQSGDHLTGLEIGVNIQAWDTDLDALAALGSGPGIVAKTGAGAFALRTLTAPAAGITVSNGTGGSGNPTLALANDLAGVEGLSGTGMAVRTATDTWANRSLATANSGRITVSNGDGISGNPTVDLAGSIVTPGTYSSVTVDTYGRVTAGSNAGEVAVGSTLTNSTGGQIEICQAVYISGGGTITEARANAEGTSKVIGLCMANIANSASGVVITNGEITATTGQWDNVTGGSGGLTPDATYYLSAATAGAITDTAPTTASQYVVEVGIALSTTKLLVNIQKRILL